MTYEYKQYLAHHGIKGQKWGNRRYQNEDGSLTEEGKRRYYKDEGFARNFLGGDFGLRKTNELYGDKSRQLSYDAKRRRDKRTAEKYQQMAEASDKAAKDMKAYREKTSTAKLIIQNALLNPVGGHVYRQARARGDKFLSSALQGSFGVIGYGVSVYKNKKKYGAATV